MMIDVRADGWANPPSTQWRAASDPFPPRLRIVSVVSIAYDRSGSGPPLVLIHPLGASRRVWRPVLARLSEQRDCIAVDLPGFGDSPPLSGASDPAALADALADALAGELGIEPGSAHVAGNSLGGWVALELALAGAAASVTAIAPAGLWRAPLAPKPEVARRLAQTARPLLGLMLRSSAGRRALLLGPMARPEAVPPAEAAAFVRAYVDAPGFTAVNRAMRAGTFTRLSEIAVPVTLVWPEFDRVVTRPRTVPEGIREVELPGCGHVPMWDDPAAVATALLEGSDVLSDGRAAQRARR
jgi:pimeloyl-ACP methyl ester carboxylesterase